MLDNLSEVRVTFTFQSVSADLTTMGDIGSSRLYAQYGDYQSLGMEIGLLSVTITRHMSASVTTRTNLHIFFIIKKFSSSLVSNCLRKI